MKKIALLLLLFLALPATSYCQEKPVVTLFYAPHCNACFKIKEEILPPLKEKYEGKIRWQALDTHDSENLGMLEAVTDYFEGEMALIPTMIVGNHFLVGYDEIEAGINEAIEKARDNVREGEGISRPLEKSEVFPPMVIHMVEVGEQTGELEDMLERVSIAYENEVEASVNALTAMLEPVMILVMAVGVGFALIAILMPLVDMTKGLK